MIRVRFAPSPTGFLHIGGTRTALFNWFFARHNQGVFILRIEDTDRARSSQTYLDQILKDLQWLGLDWDEGPYFQSKRSSLYQEYAQKLLKGGEAYAQGDAIILKMPDQPFEFTDLIRGSIKFDAGTFKDQVLIKSDRTPTYNFACVVDDHDLRISHVIRGEDHISNTPKQLAIYAALKFSAPQFAHIPLIVTEERARLSKRKGAMPLSYYREQGYLPEALFNFLALLGWSPGDDRELLCPEEIIKDFTLERIVKAAAYFNPEKLEWMNGQYIQKQDTQKLTEQIMPILKQSKVAVKDLDREWLLKVVELFKVRLKKLSEFPEQADFFFKDSVALDEELKQFLQKKQSAKGILAKLAAILKEIESFDVQAIEKACRNLIAEEKIKAGELIHPVRVALTGKRTGPGLFELMAVLGKEAVLKRLAEALELINK